MTTPKPPPDASDAPPPPRPWPPGTILVHTPTRHVGFVRYETTSKGGEVLKLVCYGGSVIFAVEEVEAMEGELRPPMAREEADREVQLFVSAQPYTGPNRRLLAEMAWDGSPDQQIAALATYADWRNGGPPEDGSSDEDYRAAYDGVRFGLACHFSEWSRALDMGEGFVDHLDQKAALPASEVMEHYEEKRLENALIDHFLALRASGAPAVEVPAPPVPPPATATLAPDPKGRLRALATLRLQGAVQVLDPAVLTWGKPPEISIAVDDGDWVVYLDFERHTGWLNHVFLMPKHLPMPQIRHRAEGWDIQSGGQALTLTPVGEASVRTGRIALVSAPPDTAGRSMRYAAAWAAAWPWGAYASIGGDGTVPVLAGHTPDGVLQMVVLENCTCERGEHPWADLDRLAIRRVPLTVTAMIVLFLGGNELAWRWISLLPVGDPIDRFLRFLPTALFLWHFTAWSASRRKPWRRPAARRTQAIALALFSPALIVPLGHLLLVQPAVSWWTWPLLLLSLAALASEVGRLIRGDGAIYNQPLTADELRCFPRDEA